VLSSKKETVMNKKELLELGVPENVIEQVIVMHGKDIENTKTKYEPLQSANEALTEQLTKAQETIEGFKAMDVDAIKKAADDYQAEAKQAREEADLRIYEMQFNHALTDTLKEVGARNPATVMALLDYDKLDLDNEGNITGLEDQLLNIVGENPFLFEPSEDSPEIITGTRNHSVVGDAAVNAARKAANLPIKE
jgi:hypothetical protein